MNRIEKIKILDELFSELETHIWFTEDEAEQSRLKNQIAKIGNFESLHTAWRKRQRVRDYLKTANKNVITIIEDDGSTWVQNSLQWRIENGHLTKEEFEIMQMDGIFSLTLLSK